MAKGGDKAGAAGANVKNKNNNNNKSADSKDEGKYVELEGAVEGEVVVRFPPEASGFLHIGHAKAALLNAYYQRAYKGKLIFRFDDTNPAKEKESFEKVIEGDVEMLQIKPDIRSYTSDHFELILQKAEQMIKEGKAYVDDTPAEQMKEEREKRIESRNRNNTVEDNLKLWEKMKAGSEEGQRYCLRAKINMNSDNGCMRDPTIFRCKQEAHPRTGDRYKVYPTYDFACPIVDSFEGVTHALRTTEYMDRDAQFYWFCDALNIRKPKIAAYSRLNLMYTVLSKRKLTFFVDEGFVDGWDDPRMPTVRGILRRGLTVEGLQQFIASQGGSKHVVVMDWDKIWALNRKVVDPTAGRYSGVEQQDMVRVVVEGDVKEGDTLQVALHPKNAELGTRQVKLGKSLLVDQTDAQLMQTGTNVTFINWGNLEVKKIEKSADGKVTQVSVKLNLDNKDYKKTLKVTWLEEKEVIPAQFIYYDNIIRKPVLGKDDDFKQFINTDSKFVLDALVDSALRPMKKGDIIQIQRKGFFICDDVYSEETTPFTGKPKPLSLISIPDGSIDMNIFPVVVQNWKKRNAYVEPTPVVEPVCVAKKAAFCGAEAATLDAEIRELCEKFKKLTNTAWTPAIKLATEATSTTTKAEDVQLDGKIREQGDKVRKLKTEKAAKAVVDPEVKTLLELKEQFKKVTGQGWTPEWKPAAAACTVGEEVAIDKKIREQGDKVRDLKTAKAAKVAIDAEVKILLELKDQFKKVANQAWKPEWKPAAGGCAAAPAAAAPVSSADNVGTALDAKIREQGDKVRKLKADKAEKAAIDAEVKTLKQLKDDYKKAVGKEWKPEETKAAAPAAPKAKPAKVEKAKPAPATAGGDDAKLKKQTRLGIETKKSENYSEWYTEVITKANMIEYYDVSGCYILRPWAYQIWETIQRFFDDKIKADGVKNCYFPMFISKGALETEKTHIADFAPEVAWVTKSGQSELAEPIAIRPTSETVMYPSYAKWVQSHRDLPIRLNQWCNVVRWEFKQPTPFLRTREFLWQEGHSAFVGKEEALEEVYKILGYYAAVYEELLAIPVVKGRKTEKEKFAGGDMTTTVEAYVDVNGRGIQGATSHFLGQNFSKMFNLTFEDPNDNGNKCYAYQNSWGLSTRSIGALIMIHADDKGLVLPPRVAAVQVVVVPCGITVNTSQDERKTLLDACRALGDELKKGGIRVEVDDRDHYSPGWKFNHWELKGVPIRAEVGPKDLAKGEFVSVRRDTGAKQSWKLTAALGQLQTMLETIHGELFARAKRVRDDHLVVTESWQEFLTKLDQKCIMMSPFCGEPVCEDAIKKDSAKEEAEEVGGGPLMGAKSLCIPFEQPKPLATDAKCIHPDCTRKATCYTLFGRSY